MLVKKRKVGKTVQVQVQVQVQEQVQAQVASGYNIVADEGAGLGIGIDRWINGRVVGWKKASYKIARPGPGD